MRRRRIFICLLRVDSGGARKIYSVRRSGIRCGLRWQAAVKIPWRRPADMRKSVRGGLPAQTCGYCM